ncbi:SusD/RagB family nutrient-binding outer membrane lipoprotein [Rapidithrix thailandica]|uniref:SusD/RagB family nutrient-binding outer membrane lipoprotein n=1 Tax=Rapidithrix thailandica TaxID=413964 RepID=A0AAW9S991_9BACT
MKKLLIYILPFLVALSSCRDLEEINVNPNLPLETHPQFQLTKIQWDAFREKAGTGPLYATKMLVQTDGVNSGQYYQWDRGSFEDFGNLRDIQKMMEEAQQLESNAYIALAKFFRSFYFYSLTLTFGDIPYAQALQGETDSNFTPVYNSQKEVFLGILKELEEANTLLSEEAGSIAGDIIFDGDITQWQKTINAFRLKVLMSLSHKVGDSEFNIKSTFVQIVQNEPLFESTEDNAQLVFLDQEGNRYPEFNSSGYGSGMYMDSTFVKRLQIHQDPRLFIYCTQTKNAKEAGKAINDFTAYEGGDPAVPYSKVNDKALAGNVSKVNERYHKDPTNEPMVLIGYPEQQFILAEAVVRGWINGDANAYYQSGVKGSFKFYEMHAEGYEQYVDENAANHYLALTENDLDQVATAEEKIELIILQRYFQTFQQSGWTAFFEHLRTGYPSFRRPDGVDIPFRWIYPQSEYNYNTENVSIAIERQFGAGNDKINQEVWWLQ